MVGVTLVPEANLEKVLEPMLCGVGDLGKSSTVGSLWK